MQFLSDLQNWHDFRLYHCRRARHDETERDKMKWMEIIEIQSAENKLEVLELQLKECLLEINSPESMQTAHLFQSKTIPTDFSIHIYHNSEKITCEGSPLGLKLARSLKEYGMIHHSVWHEMTIDQ